MHFHILLLEGKFINWKSFGNFWLQNDIMNLCIFGSFHKCDLEKTVILDGYIVLMKLNPSNLVVILGKL